ncbi:hypothetical protein CSHISOI_06020 [Colletotrichum shisoi]|uniref:Uncharacterized protein n=1 Tax=Colletotrichum shisoi TaxID=2078593 RepID=A0A5Q4BQN6_9PEZI|nr:hypothetical protein CSHISOI_06020 [Colletotrichum shisoi]
MLCAITLLLFLASCLAASEPLPQVQSRSCFGSVCFNPFKKRPQVTIPDLESLINNKDSYEGEAEIPLYKDIPLITWEGSTHRRHLSYRVWRTDTLAANPGKDQELYFTVYLELHVTSKDNLWVQFKAALPRPKRKDEGVYARKGWARGRPNYGKPTIFTLRLPTKAGVIDKIDYQFNGTWCKSSIYAPVFYAIY